MQRELTDPCTCLASPCPQSKHLLAALQHSCKPSEALPAAGTSAVRDAVPACACSGQADAGTQGYC
jgi:hypothetical protein